MDKKQILSKLLLVVLSFIVTGCAVQYPSTRNVPPIESTKQESVEETTMAP